MWKRWRWLLHGSITWYARVVSPHNAARYCVASAEFSKVESMASLRRYGVIQVVWLVLFSVPAAAGTISPTPPEITSYSGLPMADYSWTQLFSLEDPATLELLGQLGNSGGFLMTGNSAWSESGVPQILVVQTPPENFSSNDGPSVPEPSSATLCGLVVVLGGLYWGGRKVPIQSQELRRG